MTVIDLNGIEDDAHVDVGVRMLTNIRELKEDYAASQEDLYVAALLTLADTIETNSRLLIMELETLRETLHDKLEAPSHSS